jgi:uncharacterized protein (TIGR03435 family)
MRTNHRELLALGVFGPQAKVGDRVELLLRRGREFSTRASRVRVAVSIAVLLGFIAAGSVAPKWVAFAQKLEFEVASVKPAPWTGQGCVGCIAVRGNTLTAEHADLYDLVRFAYDLKQDVQLAGGPPWAVHGMLDSSTLFQVIAKTPADTPPPMDQFREMLQTLLANRFKLQVHHVKKDLPVYNLVVGKNGPKLKESAAETKFSSMQRPLPENPRQGLRMTVTHETIQQFVGQIGAYTGRPLLDKTGLVGAYDFEMSWIQDRLGAAGPDPSADPGGPTLLTAVQELGLKLEPGMAQFDAIVIDHVEKPDAN